MPREGHVSLWHPWKDKPGTRHILALFKEMQFTSIDQIVDVVGNQGYYGLVEDILSGLEVSSDLLRHKKTETYLSHTGGAVALRIKGKRKSGFLIPSKNWGDLYPTGNTIKKMEYIFKKFHFEALTSASLSEKVLRSTLQEKLYISRPAVMLRDTFIKYDKGGRIDRSTSKKFYKEAFENDINKAYLEYSRNVVSPFVSPVRFWHDQTSWQSARQSWMNVQLTCKHDGGLQPIQIPDEYGFMREPFDGEKIDTWLWSDELQDCLNSGYKLNFIEEGYFWDEMSSFMSQWSDILWNAYSTETSDEIKDIEKGMMVGLPGRFLKKPEKYTLVHKSEAKEHDIPLLQSWSGGKSPLSEWCMRVEEDMDSAQLTPVGSFIVMQCRRDIYRDAKKEEQSGNKVIRIYIDSFTTTQETIYIKKSKRRGEYKTKYYTQVTIRNNRFLGKDINGKLVLKAPAVSGEEARKKAIKELEFKQWQNEHSPP